MPCDTCGEELQRDDSHIRCQSCITKLNRIEQRKALMIQLKKFKMIEQNCSIEGNETEAKLIRLALDYIIYAIENPDEVLK